MKQYDDLHQRVDNYLGITRLELKLTAEDGKRFERMSDELSRIAVNQLVAIERTLSQLPESATADSLLLGQRNFLIMQVKRKHRIPRRIWNRRERALNEYRSETGKIAKTLDAALVVGQYCRETGLEIGFEQLNELIRRLHRTLLSHEAALREYRCAFEKRGTYFRGAHSTALKLLAAGMTPKEVRMQVLRPDGRRVALQTILNWQKELPRE